MDMKQIFMEGLKGSKSKSIVSIDYEPELFEASDDIKKEIKDLLKGDKTASNLKRLAIKNKENVPDYLDHIYNSYEKQIEKMSKKYKIDYDKIAKAFIEVKV